MRGDGRYDLRVDGELRADGFAIPAGFASLAPKGVGFAKHGNTGDLFVSWVRLRKYVAVPPTVVLEKR